MALCRVPALVSSSWLKQRLPAYLSQLGKGASSSPGSGNDAPLRLLDTSWVPEPDVDGYKEFYSKSHIPGAAHFDLKTLSPKRPDSPIDCPIPDLKLFREYVESFGITNNTHVIAYDSLNTRPSVRTWFLFRLFGHDQVSILNGGMVQWVKEGNDVTAEEPDASQLRSGEPFNINFRSDLLLDYQAMLKVVDAQSAQLLDSRPGVGGFYITDDDKSGGHMPGAKSLPFPIVFNKDGTFKSKEDLAALFANNGVDLNQPIVATCQRGMTACALAVAGHVLGVDNIPVYNGSWLEWSAIAEPRNIVQRKKE
ncbi:thiosulfate sulfurtransferase-like [Aplysia californica]|uniref:Thiosulfate sulfurtransferase-like n=1 Tax=Aplysia californica TaxID=6500 RepID=A0ABM1VZB0_APLCA|nr:thiosulfate sulfurtransferase-like [Aplysia californica]